MGAGICSSRRCSCSCVVRQTGRAAAVTDGRASAVGLVCSSHSPAGGVRTDCCRGAARLVRQRYAGAQPGHTQSQAHGADTAAVAFAAQRAVQDMQP
jgi:hypothetical protein